MPMAIGLLVVVGVLALAFLSPLAASASESEDKPVDEGKTDDGTGTGETSGGGETTTPGLTVGDIAKIGKGVLEEILTLLDPVAPSIPVVMPRPTPGMFYEIQDGDNGTLICAMAYGGAALQPYKVWLERVVPANATRLKKSWETWFSHLWTAGIDCKWNAGGHRFATVYVPTLVEAGLA